MSTVLEKIKLDDTLGILDSDQAEKTLDNVEKALSIFNSFYNELGNTDIVPKTYFEGDELVLEWSKGQVHSTFAVNVFTEVGYFLSHDRSGEIADIDYSNFSELLSEGIKAINI